MEPSQYEDYDIIDRDSDLGYGSLNSMEMKKDRRPETLDGFILPALPLEHESEKCSSKVKRNKELVGQEATNLVKKLRKLDSGKNTLVHVSRHEADEGYVELVDPFDFSAGKISEPNLKIGKLLTIYFTRSKIPMNHETQIENRKIDETVAVNHCQKTSLVTSAPKYAAPEGRQKQVDIKAVSHHTTPPEILENKTSIQPTEKETKQKATNETENSPTTATFGNVQQSTSQFWEVPELMTSAVDLFSCKMLVKGYRKCLVVVVGFISGVCFLVYWVFGKESAMPGEEMLDASDGIDESAENLESNQTLVSYRTELSNGYHRYSFELKD